MSENMPSHSFVARYPNYVQDASSTCVCGEIRDSAIHNEDARVKEIRERVSDNFRSIGNDEWRGHYSRDVRYLLSLLPVQPVQEDGISWTALLASLERLRSKNRNPESEWYHGWNAAIQCLINDVNARAVRPAASTPTERCTCDHFEHKDTGECLTCGMFCGLVNPTTDEVIILRLIVRALAEYLETDQILSAVSGMGIINDNTRTLIQSIVGTAADVSTYRSRCCDARVIIGSNGSVECSRCHTDYWTNLPTPAVATGNKGQR